MAKATPNHTDFTPRMVDGVDINVDGILLSQILNEMVTATQSIYGSHIRIAAKFNDLMDFSWFDVEANEKGDYADRLKPHKTDLFAAFKLAGHSNPSVPFKRIRDYGRNLANGLSPNGKTTLDGDPVEGEGEGEGEGPVKRSDRLFAAEESIKLWKRMSKSDDVELVAFSNDLAAIMQARLGIDVRTIATK
jgi:hypothetical protein